MYQQTQTIDVDVRGASHRLNLTSLSAIEFVDLTEDIKRAVSGSRVRNGFVNVQTRHTTTGIVINENEPLLLSDMVDLLERLVPTSSDYRHDDFSIRTANLTPDERSNGHAHCRALFLRASECINIIEGELDLGRWQRIFLLELDGPRERAVSLTVLGQ
jgi:secondary thiamine-phosphate synthase enzyme